MQTDLVATVSLAMAIFSAFAAATRQHLPPTETKRAFLSDFLTANHAGGSKPPNWHVNINRYFTLIMDCWPRATVKNLMRSHSLFFRNLETHNNAELRKYPDRFNNYEIIDFDCEKSLNMLQTSVWDNSDWQQRWRSFFKQILILVDEGNFADLIRVIEAPAERIQVNIASRIIIAKCINGERYKLYLIYRIGPETPLIYEDLGNWSWEIGLTFIHAKQELTTKRRDLKGLFFKISMTIDVPETKQLYHTFKNPEIDTTIKNTYALFNGLVSMVNMTFEEVFHDSYGVFDAKAQNWTGKVGSLSAGLTNYSGSPLVMTKDRLKVVDYLVQISQKIDCKFIFMRPPTSYVKDIYKIAFHPYVWYTLLGMVLLYTVCIGYLLYLERILFDNVSGNANDGLLVILESISQQGTVVNSTSISGAVLFFILSTACMFFYTSYSTNIVTLLQSTTTMNTPKELLESPFEVGAEDKVYTDYFMKMEQEPIRKALYEKKIAQNEYMKTEEGLKRVRKGGFVFHVEKVPAFHYMLRNFDIREICAIQRLDALYLPSHLIYIPLPKASPYKKIFKVGVFRVFEVGLHFRHVLFFQMEPKCTGIEPSFKSIELVDIRTCYLILLSGIFLAILVFLMELFYHRRQLSMIRFNKKRLWFD